MSKLIPPTSQDFVLGATRFMRRRSAWICAPVLMALSLQQVASAANLFWDPAQDQSNGGGVGTWDTSSLFWNDDNAAPNVFWNNANLDTAIFGGTGGAVSLGVPITVGGLTFDSAGYGVSGAPLTLAGTPIITTNAAATVSSILAGSVGFSKAGSGKLTISGANTLSGGIAINAGTLSGAVATGTSPFGSNALTLGGGNLELTPTASTATGLFWRQITTSAATGNTSRIDFTNATASGFVTQVSSGTTVPGPGGAPANAGVQYTGKLKITSGGAYTFQIGSDDGSRLYIDGVLVINNDGSKGVLNMNTPSAITLSAGLHDIRMDYVNGTGGAGANLNYSGPDQVTLGAIPAAALLRPETSALSGSSNAVVVGSGLGNSLAVTASSAINLNGGDFTQVQLGDYSQTTGTTLTVNGLAGKTLRLAGNIILGSGAGTVTISNAPNVSFSGALSDGGNAVTLSKTGSGRLLFDQTATANSLGATTTLDIQGGSAVLVGSTAIGAFNPIGSAAISLNGGNLVLDSKGATITGTGPTFNNAVGVAAGQTATIQNIINAATTTLGGSGNGITLGASSNLTLDAIAGGQLTGPAAGDLGATLVVAGPLVGPSSSTLNLTSSILGTFANASRGTFTFSGNNSAFTGTVNVGSGLALTFIGNSAVGAATLNFPAGTAANFFFDGNGTGTPGASTIASQNSTSERVTFGDNVAISGSGTTTLTVGRLGTTYAPLFTQALNKTAVMGSLTIGNQTLAVNNNQGYGLEFQGGTTLSSSPTFSVATASTSNAVQGLVLSGKVSGSSGFTKSGNGTMVLSNNLTGVGLANDFVGAITVTGGVLGATSDTALGDAANGIVLNGTQASFEAFETFSTARTFTFSNATAANNLILVAADKTLTLTSALSGANPFQKGDPGTLVLSGSSGGYTAGFTASGGITRVTTTASTGTGTITIAGNSGTAVQLDGTSGAIAVPNAFSIGATTGVNSGGALQNVAGTNSVAGNITLTGAAAIGVNTGTTLNLATVTAGGNALTLLGGGTGSVSNFTGTGGLTKFGTGSWTLNGTTAFSGPVNLLQGTLTLAGGAIYNGSSTPIISQASTLVLDNSGTNNNNRLNGRFSNMWFAGELKIIGNAAAATTESTGAFANFTPSGAAGVITLVPNGAQALTLGSATAFPISRNTTSTLLFRGTGLGSTSAAGVANIKFSTGTAATGQAGAAGTANRGINPWALVDASATGFGTSLAAYDATNGYQALTLGVDTIAALPASDAAIAIPNVSTSSALSATRPLSLNSLTLASGGGLEIGLGRAVSLDSGAILALTGNTGIGTSSAGLLSTTGNKEMIVHVLDSVTGSGASLDIGATLAGFTGGLIKADGGTLNLNAKAYYTGATTVNGGVLTLAAGKNTLLPGQNLALNFGGTLALGSNSQMVGDLFTLATGGNEAVQNGGNLTSSTSAATLVVNQSNVARTFGGVVSGPLTFNKAGANTLSFIKDQTYSGPTLITGGGVHLTDSGALSGTSAIQINYGGVLTINNTGLLNSFDRVSDAAPITLRTGVIAFNGRAQTNSSETLGALTLAGGASQVTVVTGGVGINSAELIFSSFNAAGSIDGTLNFNQSAAIGNSTRILFVTAPTVTNNIVTPSIEFGATDWATYVPGLGLAQLGAAGTAGYTGTTLPVGNQPTHNIKLAASGVVPSGGLILNTLNVTGVNATFANDSDTLNLGAGGLMHTGANSAIGGLVDNGRLTAGGASASGQVPFYIHNGAGIFTINSRLTDPNGSSQLRSIFTIYNSGTIALTNGANSYTGGTVVNGWTTTSGNLSLSGGVGAVVVPAGGLTINNAAVVMNTNAGQIEASNVVTLSGAATLTLVGANTLNSLVFNNAGGTANPVVNTGGVLTLSNSTPVSVTSSNVGSVPTINGTIDFAAANKTFAVAAPTVNSQTIAPYTAALNVAGVLQNGTLTKTGNGNLQLSGQSTFAGGVNLTDGGLIIGANSTPTSGGLTSGPLGTGTLTATAGTTILSSGAFTLSNNLTLLGNVNFDGLNNLTFSGITTLPASPVTISVAAPQQTVSLVGGLVNPATNISKTGFGTLNLPSEYAGTLTLGVGGSFGILDDGNGRGSLQTIISAMSVVSSGSTTVTVGRSGVELAPYFATAANKTIQIASVDTGSAPFSVVNNNGYALENAGTLALSADQIISVANATASNVVPGFIQTGKVSGGNSIVKLGTGALLLGNPTNDFGGAGKLVDIQGGILAVGTDGALGNAANVVKLNVSGTTGVGLRATGTFSTGRTIQFAQATNSIEVTSGNTLTLTSPFTGVSATTTLVKNDNGTLELNAANSSTWTGTTTLAGVMTGGVQVNAGYVKITDPAALGNAANPIIVTGLTNAGIQISGGITVPNPATLNTTGSNNYAGGLNWGGTLRSVSGNNTWSGLIQTNQDSGVSADAGSTLNITGGIAQNVHILVYGGAGNINVTTNPITSVHTLDKIGSGTLNIQVATAAPSTTNGIRVYAGNLTFSGAAGAVATGGNLLNIQPGGTVTLDNSGSVLANRLGGRVMTMVGGNLNLIGGATVTGEAIGAPSFNRGQNTITVTSGAGGANLTFTAGSNNVNPAQSTGGSGSTGLFRGTNLGSAAGAGNATISWTAGGLGFNGNTGATDTTNKGLVPWALFDSSATGLGTSFVTADSAAAAGNTGTAILRALKSTEYSTATTLTANGNMLVTTGLTGLAGNTINSLTIDTGGSLTMAAGQSLVSSSGGVLVRNGVTSTISGGLVSIPGTNSALNIHTPGTADLTISSVMTGGNGTASIGIVKAGAGTLTLSTPKISFGGLTALSANTLNMQTVVNQGMLKLDGGTNTLGTNNYLEVGAGGTLDLNGTSQYVLGLFTDGTYNGIADTTTAGGIVRSTAAATLVTNSDSRNWAGEITGNVFYNRTGTFSTTTMYTPQSYTGGTLVNGGELKLRDYAKLSNTSAIDINYAFVTLDNGQAAGISGRLGTAPITLRGAGLFYAGRVQTALSETAGAVSLAQGFNHIYASNPGTGVNSSDFTLTSLSRPVGSSAVVNFANNSGAAQQTGQVGSVSRVLFGTEPTLSNNLIGPWAIASREWASYVPGLGTGKLNDPGFAGYATTTLATASATDNVRVTGTTPVLTANTTVNTLNVNYTANTTVDLGTKTLTLAGGGLMLASTSTGTISNGSITSGALNVGGDLYLYHLPYAGTGRVAVIGANVVDNGSGPVRLIVSSSENPGTAQTVTLSGVNTNTGGFVANLGTTVVGTGGVIPAGGISLNGAALSEAIAGQATPGTIASANVVTLNGGSTLSLANNSTLAGLVFNNNGAGYIAAASANANPTVNTFVQGAGTNGRGVLTIGASGIVADSSNVATTSQIVGRIDMGSSANTITVNPITVNGTNVAPLQAALIIQGLTGSSGGITKAGNGVLQLNAQSTFTGTLTVTGGGVNFGTLGNTGTGAGNAAGSRFSQMVLGANTWLNLTNTDATIGSLSGAGTVFNANQSSGALPSGRTLNVGFDDSDTTFSGSFARWSDALANPFQVNKIGAGTMTLTGVSTTTNNLLVSQGGVTYSGNGTGLFGTTLVLPTGTLTLDNTTTNVNGRLNGATNVGTLSVNGGEFVLRGNSLAATTEVIGTLNLSGGNQAGRSTITLIADPAKPLTFTVGTTFQGFGNNDSGLIRGISGTAGNGLANLSIGTIGLGAQNGAGTGANGTTTMPIRADLLGDASATGLGTGFITKDSATNFLRPLTDAELAPTLTSSTTTNYGLTTSNLIDRTSTAFSVTLKNGGGVANANTVANFGIFGTDGLPVQLKVGSGGFLAFSGNTGINVGRVDTSNNMPFYFHTIGNLSVTGSLANSTGGLVKADDGTLTINSPGYYTGTTTVNRGTMILNGGANTLPLYPTAGAPSTVALGIHAGTIDLNGNSQTTGTLFSNNRYANSGGTLTNTATGTPVNYTTILGSVQVFGGVIAGNLNFIKTGNNALTLNSPNTFTGTTTVRASTLILMDSGTLANTTAVNLHYAGLTVDQSGLNTSGNLNPTRVPATVPINLSGSTLTFNSGGSADYSQTFNTVNALQGNSAISVPNAPAGATGALNIGNLVVNADATINLVGGSNGFFNAAPGMGISNLYITSLNGVAIPAAITNKILGGNILVNNSEFATYVQPTTTGALGQNYGVVTMNGIAAIAQTQYDANAATFPASNVASNVRLSTAGTVTLPAGTTTSYNSLALRVAGITIAFNTATDKLNIASGGLALTSNTAVVGVSAGSGILTSGGAAATGVAPLYIHSTGATINSVIADNGNGAKTRAVFNTISGTLTLVSANTYTGGTVANGGTVAVTTGTIPAGGLTINSAAVTATTAQNSINTTNDVTLNGSSTLTLGNFANTLNSLTFNNNGGAANPTVTIGTTSLTLSATDAITVVNDNVATIPTIAGTLLSLPAGANINTSGQSIQGLLISAPIAAAGAVNKTGTGSLILTSGSSAFSGGFNLNAGSLVFGAGTSGTVPSITSGPVGTGTLALGDGTAIMSDGTLRTIGNAVTISGNVTFGTRGTLSENGSAVAGNGVTLSGAVGLGSAGRMVNVNGLLNTSTISGAITSTLTAGSTPALVKDGTGTLVLSSTANNFNGNSVRVAGGVLKIGTASTITGATTVAQTIGASVIPANSRLVVAAGAIVDLNNVDVAVGSLSSDSATTGGVVTNSGAAAKTLYVGADGTTSTFGGIITNGAQALNLVKVGTGNLILTNANSFTGTVRINRGSLTLTNSGALGTRATLIDMSSAGTPGQPALHLDGSTVNGSVILPSALSFSTSTGDFAGTGGVYNDAGDNTINGNFTLNSGGGGTKFVSTSGTLTLNGTLTPNTTARSVQLDGAGDGVINGVISGSGANAMPVTKVGSGTWTLNGSNSYSGITTMTGGTLRITSIANGGVNSSLGASTNAAANLVFDGGTLEYAGSTISTDRNFTITAAKAGTISVSNAATNLTITGASTATTGQLVKAGPGTLTLAASQLHTGSTRISGGTLALSDAGALSDASRVILEASGSSFDISSITASLETVASVSGIAASSLKLGSKTLELGGDNTSFDVASDVTGSGGSLQKTGTGTMTISGSSNTYSGATNLNGGTLLLGANNVLPNSAAFTLSGGTTLSTGGFSDATGAFTLGNSAVIDMGNASSILSFTDVSAWTGVLSVWNWNGSLRTGGGTDQLIFTGATGLVDLPNVNFYSGAGTGLLGGGGAIFDGTELVPVPEPGAVLTGLLLLVAIGYRERRCRTV